MSATATTAPQSATDRQINFLIKLLAEKDLTGTAFGSWSELPVLENLSKSQASDAITMLLGLPRKASSFRSSPAGFHAPGAQTDGIYRTPTGEIYKVQVAVHGSGQLYAKRLVIIEHEDGTRSGEFEIARGMVRKLDPSWKLTLEQAREFGSLYGFCVRCGATLTDEGSIAAGIGPVCATRF